MLNPQYLNGDTWGFPGAPVEHIETHAAHVFLAGERAFKIKKDVKLPYLDFSTAEKRRAALRAEFEINRGFAPDLYIGVSEVLGEPVLSMHRFDQRDMLSWKLKHGGISPLEARALAAAAAASHRAAARRTAGGADVMAGLGAQLSGAFTQSPDLFPPAGTLEFHALYEAALKRLKPLLNARGEQGLVRRCHGDLHANNIIIRDGKPALFDAIEFSEKIATIDVLYDLAFLLMDLQRRGAAAAANIVFNHYLHLRREVEDLSGLAALPLFLSTRAGVRALVTADLVHELPVDRSLKLRGDALDYFRLSIGFLKPPPPRLICIGGLSGTGKSTVAAGLAPSIGEAPGALVIRTDQERKVLAGVAETDRLPASHYSRAASLAVYEFAFNRAERALKAGHAVILDAVFAHDSERHVAERLAARCGAGFAGFWLQAPVAMLKDRVGKRQGDASDATAEVVDMQAAYHLGQMNWAPVDAAGPPEAAEQAVRRMLQSRSGAPS